MNNTRLRTRIRSYSNPLACVVALALLAGCNPSPNVPETPATPIVAAPTPTALPPTALPPTPTALPPTTLPVTAAAAELPTESATAQTDADIPASTGYLVYQRPDGSLWRAEKTDQLPTSLTEPTEPEALLPWAAAPDGKTIAVVLGTGLWYRFHENP